MIKKSITTKKVGRDLISECEVFDEESGRTYYVVTQLGDLLFAVFESSYLAYKRGDSDLPPVKVEGENYLWFSYEAGHSDTRFFEYYIETLKEASSREHKTTIRRKYSHLKKPFGNIKYEIVDKCYYDSFVFNGYDMEFYLPEEDRYMLVRHETETGGYVLFATERIELATTEELPDDCEIIEQISSFFWAKKSKYYDLYLELEKFKDGV